MVAYILSATGTMDISIFSAEGRNVASIFIFLKINLVEKEANLIY